VAGQRVVYLKSGADFSADRTVFFPGTTSPLIPLARYLAGVDVRADSTLEYSLLPQWDATGNCPVGVDKPLAGFLVTKFAAGAVNGVNLFQPG